MRGWWWESQGLSPGGVHSTCLIPSLFLPAPPSQELPREGDDETTNEAPHIQCADGCDPQGLRDNSQVP